MNSFLMEVLAGVLLAILCLAIWRRFSAYERLLAGLSLIAAAAFYPMLGLAAGLSASQMAVQLIALGFTVALGALGVRSSMWFLALGWLMHGPWDLLAPYIEDVSHMPAWYAGVCLGFDILVGIYWAIRARGGLPIRGQDAGTTTPMGDPSS